MNHNALVGLVTIGVILIPIVVSGFLFELVKHYFLDKRK